MSVDSEKFEIPARRGKAVHVTQGSAIEIINTHGHQVVDFWAFRSSDLNRYLSMPHCRAALNSIWPKNGDTLVDNERRAIIRLEADSFHGRHDTIIPPCDRHRYELLGCKEYHDNCVDNMFRAMKELDMSPPYCPASLNLWMNIPVSKDGDIEWLPPVSKPGDSVRFTALVEIVAVMSACPQDIIPINKRNPVSAHFRLVRG